MPASTKRKVVVSKDLQLQEAIATVAVAVLAINLTIVLSTLFAIGHELAQLHLTFKHYIVIGLTEIGLMGLLFFVSLRRTAKVAGPVKAIAREVAKLGRGDLSVNVDLRKGDAFEQEAREINQAVMSLRDRIAHVKQLCVNLRSSLPEGASSEALIADLQRELDDLLAPGPAKQTV